MGESTEPYYYRVTKRVPPDDDSYLTPSGRYGADPPAGASDETRLAWDTGSFYTTEDGARRVGLAHTHLGGKIVRFRITPGSGIVCDPPDEAGHVNVRGDKEALARCYDPDFVAQVKQSPSR